MLPSSASRGGVSLRRSTTWPLPPPRAGDRSSLDEAARRLTPRWCDGSISTSSSLALSGIRASKGSRQPAAGPRPGQLCPVAARCARRTSSLRRRRWAARLRLRLSRPPSPLSLASPLSPLSPLPRGTLVASPLEGMSLRSPAAGGGALQGSTRDLADECGGDAVPACDWTRSPEVPGTRRIQDVPAAADSPPVP